MSGRLTVQIDIDINCVDRNLLNPFSTGCQSKVLVFYKPQEFEIFIRLRDTVDKLALEKARSGREPIAVAHNQELSVIASAPIGTALLATLHVVCFRNGTAEILLPAMLGPSMVKCARGFD